MSKEAGKYLEDNCEITANAYPFAGRLEDEYSITKSQLQQYADQEVKKEVLKALEEITRISNNALYFNDNSDYCTALWEILSITKPELFKESDEPKLEYIEK